MTPPKIIQLGGVIQARNRDNPQRGRVYDPKGIAPTIYCMGGGNQQPLILIQDEETDNHSVEPARPRKCSTNLERGVCPTIGTTDLSLPKLICISEQKKQ